MLFNFLNDERKVFDEEVKFSGNIEVVHGILNEELSILHARSLAEDVIFYDNNKNLLSGNLNIQEGKAPVP